MSEPFDIGTRGRQMLDDGQEISAIFGTKNMRESEVKTIPEIIDELTYASYRFNRQHSPEIGLDMWRISYQNVDELEARFQKEVPEETKEW